MATRRLTWTDKQKEIADLLRGGASRQEIMAKGHSKTAVGRVAGFIKDELEERRKQARNQAETKRELKRKQLKLRLKHLETEAETT